MKKPNEGCRFRSSAWFMMFQKKKHSDFSFKPKESGNPLHQCLVHVTFSSSPFNISIICGPHINQASSNFPKCLRFFTFLPSMWQLSHLDLSRPYWIFPPFSCSNPSYIALNYARTIFLDDDANSDACLNLISNRTSTFPKENKDDTALPVYRKLHRINP